MGYLIIVKTTHGGYYCFSSKQHIKSNVFDIFWVNFWCLALFKIIIECPPLFF
nr:MAG TPA: hypothetical protein [Caudoviricetes sp.]